MHILLAEDNKDDVTLLREGFAAIGATHVRISHVPDGANALAILQSAAADEFQCVILDYYLPLLSGMQVAQALHDGKSLGGVPVIILTTHILPGERLRLLELGVRLVAEKPNSLEGLCALASQILGLLP